MKYVRKANLSTKSFSDISELELLRMQKVAEQLVASPSRALLSERLEQAKNLAKL